MIARIEQAAIKFQLKLPRRLGCSRQKDRYPLANLTARAIANSVRTFYNRLLRFVEDDVKQNCQDYREAEQAQSKDLAQGRFHKSIPA
jgi:hypothetical protein